LQKHHKYDIYVLVNNRQSLIFTFYVYFSHCYVQEQ
jgi:hypothetical protein